MNPRNQQDAPVEVSDLMQKPVCMMSGEELCILARYANSSSPNSPSPSGENGQTSVIGIKDLAAFIGCSESTIYSIKKQGVLDPAIVAQVGRKIVFNAPLARDLANAFQQQQRDLRREK